MEPTLASIRRAFTDFFVEKGHHLVPSMGLIPTHHTAPLFANAGMNQFVSYMLGEEQPPWPRAVSVQKAVRISGKDNDIDQLGKTRRHLTFFEMLGNFSFGDYFKEEAIAWAWELLTERVGFDGDRLWATVHDSDDAAEAIWHERIGLPMDRIQRLGDKDNFWEMADTGPCGPCSEIHFDCGPEWGDDGGPGHGGGDRYVEFWNLVFMQNFRHGDGSITDLPKRNVDTGAGLERWLMLLAGTPTVFETTAVRPLIAEAESITGVTYRDGEGGRSDASLRVIGDHARTMTFLVGDGVTPSNEGRGYPLRGLIRRAVRHLHQLGVDAPALAPLVLATVDHMADAYPELTAKANQIAEVIEREEGRFRQTLRAGLTMLESELASGEVSGEVAFTLHDTHGFPIEITEEIADERGTPIDRAAFDRFMAGQRERAQAARKAVVVDSASLDTYRRLVAESGPTEFVGYDLTEAEAKVVAVLAAAGDGGDGADGNGRLEVFLDRTPFYAEGGGQVGDTGTITTPSGVLRVLDTTPALPGLHRHLVEVVEGDRPAPGDEARAEVAAGLRTATTRNHTGTHLLQAALREVLGPQVHQQSSHVAPGGLRFDLNHHEAVSAEQLAEVEALVNGRVLGNDIVHTFETTLEDATARGALAFFGDKYGEVVRVVEAGRHSVELCGGTHVHALGGIGPMKIVSEGSIGSNLRRVEAVTGEGALAVLAEDDRRLARAAALLKVRPDEVVEGIERLLARQRELSDEMKAVRSKADAGEAKSLLADARNGAVVARIDGRSRDELRDLAVATRQSGGAKLRAVVLAGSPDGEGVVIVGVVAKDSGLVAGELVVPAAQITGGGGNAKAADVAVAGGKDVTAIDAALADVRARLGG